MAYRAPDYKVAAVLGGTGFIGRYVVRELARRGWRVNVLTREPGRALFLKPMGAVGQIVPVFANIRDADSLAVGLRGADYVINTVGILAEGGNQTFEVLQAQGPGQLGRLAKEAGVERIVHISAIGADPQSPSAYARTKAAGEAALREAFPDASILRPSIVFGPEDGFFNMFAGLARYLPALPLIGGGRTRFQPVYVGDVADAVMACLDRADTPGRTYELGGPRTYTFRELIEMILAATHRRRFLVTAPWPVARLQARVLSLMPKPLLTPDQVVQLERDNVVSHGAAKLADLGIDPTDLELVLPTYMDRYRPGGRFADRRHAA
ncbi:MAG: complex I NDUFA9 subunit family protein [Azospirillaceae bacterium]